MPTQSGMKKAAKSEDRLEDNIDIHNPPQIRTTAHCEQRNIRAECSFHLHPLNINACHRPPIKGQLGLRATETKRVLIYSDELLSNCSASSSFC